MPNPKRVSVKGRGADIFFGDYPTLGARPATEETAAPAPTETGAGQLAERLTPPPSGASEHLDEQASLQETKQASLLAGEIANVVPPVDDGAGPASEQLPVKPVRASKQARKQESKKASLLANEIADMDAPASADAVTGLVDEQASLQASKQESLLSDEVADMTTSASADVAAGSIDKQACLQESKQARKKASKLAGKTVGAAESAAAVIPEGARAAAGLLAADVVEALMPFMGPQATITNTFRFTDEELSWLTDAAYALSKRHHIKLAKQDIVRLGLNAILWDWQERGGASLLGTWVNRWASREDGRK